MLHLLQLSFFYVIFSFELEHLQCLQESHLAKDILKDEVIIELRSITVEYELLFMVLF